MAFVRLRDAVVLESALETRVPVRFFFILIGPTKNDMNYHECGRAMAALLADKVRPQTVAQILAKDHKEQRCFDILVSSFLLHVIFANLSSGF